LHWALHQVLGEHAKQAGSVVEPARLRFDFSHHKALSLEEIRKIEDLVNNRIRENRPVHWYEIPYEEAQKKPEIKQFFGEKYGSQVRVVDIEFSKELCGGVHVHSLGTIGLFRIAKEGSIASGVRRIEAVTGAEAETFSRHSEDQIHTLCTLLKTQPAKLQERIEKLTEETKKLEQELAAHRQNQRKTLIHSLLQEVENVKGIPAVIKEVSLSIEELRPCLEEMACKMTSGVIILGASAADKCQVVIRVSDDFVAKGIHAQAIAKVIAPLIEGSGGGKPNFAQAGGKSSAKLSEALAEGRKVLVAS